MCFRLPATGGAPWTSTQDSFAAVRAQRTWKAVAYEWRRGLAAKEYINIHDTTWLSGSSVRAHPTHRPEASGRLVSLSLAQGTLQSD